MTSKSSGQNQTRRSCCLLLCTNKKNRRRDDSFCAVGTDALKWEFKWEKSSYVSLACVMHRKLTRALIQRPNSSLFVSALTICLSLASHAGPNLLIQCIELIVMRLKIFNARSRFNAFFSFRLFILVVFVANWTCAGRFVFLFRLEKQNTCCDFIFFSFTNDARRTHVLHFQSFNGTTKTKWIDAILPVFGRKLNDACKWFTIESKMDKQNGATMSFETTETSFFVSIEECTIKTVADKIDDDVDEDTKIDTLKCGYWFNCARTGIFHRHSKTKAKTTDKRCILSVMSQ